MDAIINHVNTQPATHLLVYAPTHSKAHRDAARAEKQRFKATLEQRRTEIEEFLAQQEARRAAEEADDEG